MRFGYWRKRLNYASSQVKFIIGFLCTCTTLLCLGMLINTYLYKIPTSFIESLISEIIAGAFTGTIVGFFLIFIEEQGKRGKNKEDAVFHANKLMGSIMELEARGKIPLVIAGPTKNLLGSEINSLFDTYKLFEKNIFLIKKSIRKHPTISALESAISFYKIACLTTEDFDDLLRSLIRKKNYESGINRFNDSRDLVYVRARLFSKDLGINKTRILEILDLPKKPNRLEKLYLTIAKNRKLINLKNKILSHREKLNNELIRAFKSANY
ncbi:MAG: hypothetical protein ABIB61_01605 [Candidatus Shapirobacteria bacterium]